MTTRRCLLLFGLGTAVCASALVIMAIALRPKPGVMPGNFHRLWVWMPEEEAEAILGGPAHVRQNHTAGWHKTWIGDDCTITLRGYCGREGYVIVGGRLMVAGELIEELPEEERRNEKLLDRVRRWVGL